jgi:catechol 2,3-dioxygenase-like lactoylglutathione lyase family enzyme
MLDHIILTVSDVERSLAFYEAALKPLNIKFFMPYKGKDGHPDLWGFGDGERAFFWIKQGKPDPAAIHWGFMAEDERKVDEFYQAAISAGARNNISPARDSNTIRDTTPLMYSTLTGIRSRSSIKARTKNKNRTHPSVVPTFNPLNMRSRASRLLKCRTCKLLSAVGGRCG